MITQRCNDSKAVPNGHRANGRARRKRRVRRHVIADISFHHLALMVVRCGYTIEQATADYGYDASIITYDEAGFVENAPFWIQLKATDRLDRDPSTDAIRFTVDRRDIDLWADNPLPVYLVLFDAGADTAYWLHLQRYFSNRNIAADRMSANSHRVTIDPSAIVDLDVIRSWRDEKNRQTAKMSELGHE